MRLSGVDDGGLLRPARGRTPGCAAMYWSMAVDRQTRIARLVARAPAGAPRLLHASKRACPGSRSAPRRPASRCRRPARARSSTRPRGSPGRAGRARSCGAAWADSRRDRRTPRRSGKPPVLVAVLQVLGQHLHHLPRPHEVDGLHRAAGEEDPRTGAPPRARWRAGRGPGSRRAGCTGRNGARRAARPIRSTSSTGTSPSSFCGVLRRVGGSWRCRSGNVGSAP